MALQVTFVCPDAGAFSFTSSRDRRVHFEFHAFSFRDNPAVGIGLPYVVHRKIYALLGAFVLLWQQRGRRKIIFFKLENSLTVEVYRQRLFYCRETLEEAMNGNYGKRI